MTDVWYALKNQDRYVYHYTRAATLINHILPSRRLRFSRFQTVNDPRESRDWLFAVYSLEPGDYDFEDLQRRLNASLKHSWRLGCFVSDPYEAVINKQREDKGEDILGAMYERGHSRPRMWAQYAEDFAGACLVFDRGKLDEGITACADAVGAVVYKGPVEYRNPRIAPDLTRLSARYVSRHEIVQLGLDVAMERHISRHWKELFFLKARDWEQEREYRWLVSGKENEDFFVDICDSLAGIALGDRFPDCLKPKVARQIESWEVKVAIMGWRNGVPQPDPTLPRLLAQADNSPKSKLSDLQIIVVIAACLLAAILWRLW